MAHELIYTLIAVIIISLISLVGVLYLALKKKTLNRFMLVLVAFSAGTLLATAFFDFIPETQEAIGGLLFVVIGIIAFFLVEAFVHWHHHHEEECKDCVKPVVYLNLFGDALHNFVDGIIIAAAFIISIPGGIATTIALALHEIPQEIGDFAVLIHGGLSKGKALLFNFLSASFAILGGLLSYLFLSKLTNLLPYVIALAAGGFIYIAVADLFPELHKEKDKKKIIIQTIAMLVGILMIWFLFQVFPE